jgi:hypothetical protein
LCPFCTTPPPRAQHAPARHLPWSPVFCMVTSAPLPVVVQLGSGSALRPGCVCARPSSLCEHEAASNLCSPCLMRARIGFSWEEIDMLMGVPVPAPSSRAGREQHGQRAGTRITERGREREARGGEGGDTDRLQKAGTPAGTRPGRTSRGGAGGHASCSSAAAAVNGAAAVTTTEEPKADVGQLPARPKSRGGPKLARPAPREALCASSGGRQWPLASTEPGSTARGAISRGACRRSLVSK